MTKHIRRKVIRFEERPNTGPSGHLWPRCWSAVLECGHILDLGVQQDYRPKRMACYECGVKKEVQ
jgi:hypothetical protein